jgi:hypothetical protein
LSNIILLDLTPEKDDICILIDVVNGEDTGKITQVLTSQIFMGFSQNICIFMPKGGPHYREIF